MGWVEWGRFYGYVYVIPLSSSSYSSTFILFGGGGGEENHVWEITGVGAFGRRGNAILMRE